MRRGKLGLSFSAYAVIAFVLALCVQMPLCFILFGFVLAVEKDEWTGRQCLQAFILSFASGILGILTLLFFGAGHGAMVVYGEATPRVIGLIPLAVWIVLIVFTIRALVRVAKGQEADIPLFSDWAFRAFGYVRRQPQTPPPPYQPPHSATGYSVPHARQPYQPQQPPQYQPQPPHPQPGPGGYPGAPQGSPVPPPYAPVQEPPAQVTPPGTGNEGENN